MTTKANRDQTFTDAMANTGAYTATRWSSLPKEVRQGLSVACLTFQRMSDEEKLAALLLLWQRSTVLAIDRANQLADLSAASDGASMAA